MHSRKSSWVFFAVVAVLCALILRGAWVYRAPDDETVTVSPETTGIVEPLRADGSVDYAAATRRVLSDGATAETNAAIPLIRAAGPRCIERPLRASILAELGIGDLPEDGDYLVILEEHASARGFRSPVDPDAYPHVDDWLAANEKPLEHAAAASRRTRFYWPIPRSAAGTDLPAWAGSLGFRASFQVAGLALAVRSRRRLSRGDVDAAWEDALAALRLGRLARRFGTQLAEMTGCGIERTAFKAMEDILGRGEVDDALASARLDSLDGLPTPRDGPQQLWLSRCYFLDVAWSTRKPGALTPEPKIYFSLAAHLRRWNRCFDELERAVAVRPPWDRIEACRDVSERLKARALTAGTRMQRPLWWAALPFRSRASIRAEVGEGLADCLAAIVASNTRGEVVGSVATAMELDLTRVALALARWKARRGTYPDVLDDLVPDLVPTLAADAFKGAPLRYRREEEGYVLWSVGPNGRDDGGEDGRDLVFRAKR